MTTNTLALALPTATRAPRTSHRSQVGGKHARTAEQAVDIRVLACPGGVRRRRPLHARAQVLPAEAPIEQPNRLVLLHRSVQGAAFNLSGRERIFARAAGTLLAAGTLAAAII